MMCLASGAFAACTSLNSSTPVDAGDDGGGQGGAGGSSGAGGVGGSSGSGSGAVGGSSGAPGGSGGAGAGGMSAGGDSGTPDLDSSTPDLDSSTPDLDASNDAGQDAAPPLAMCGALTAPDNGTLSVEGETEGDVASYGCEDGYGLVGVASRTCGSDGEWTGEAPSCAPGDCASLSSPEHGTVQTPSGTTFGAVAQYDCLAGYDLSGSTTRTCQANGTWSGSAPTCQIVSCPTLSAPADGTISTPDGRTYGAVASYGCEPGFYRVGGATRTCQASGAWSGSAPSCADSQTEGLRLAQLHVGNDEFVRITNRGAQTATLTGVRLELRDSSGSNYILDFTSGTLAAGASATIGDLAASPTYTLSLNLAGSRAATVLLCEASPCSASTVLDAMSFEGGGVAPAMPAGISINTPVAGMTSTNDTTEDFYRMAYAGTAPSFRSCDWVVAPAQPIFAESFECGTTGWTAAGTGAFTTNSSNTSPDGSPLTLVQTAGTINPTDGLSWTFGSAIKPTHIEYWQQGGNRVFLCSGSCNTSTNQFGATVYWDYQGNLCFVASQLSCHDTPDFSWSRVVIDQINWTTGTATYRVNDDFAVGVTFSGSYVADSGLRSISITGGGGRVDGIRMW